jgi:hypothetical protein
MSWLYTGYIILRACRGFNFVIQVFFRYNFVLCNFLCLGCLWVFLGAKGGAFWGGGGILAKQGHVKP